AKNRAAHAESARAYRPESRSTNHRGSLRRPPHQPAGDDHELDPPRLALHRRPPTRLTQPCQLDRLLLRRLTAAGVKLNSAEARSDLRAARGVQDRVTLAAQRFS